MIVIEERQLGTLRWMSGQDPWTCGGPGHGAALLTVVDR